MQKEKKYHFNVKQQHQQLQFRCQALKGSYELLTWYFSKVKSHQESCWEQHLEHAGDP